MPQDTADHALPPYNAIWDVLADGLPVVIASHERLDGDGIGCALALWHALCARDVSAHLVVQQPVPSLYAFLPGIAEAVCDGTDLPDRFNLAVIDCGAMDRIGPVASRLNGCARIVNIDHHDTNAGFGDVNYVNPSASSCGEMLYGVLAAGGVQISPAIADCLYTAIVTDTGQFSHQDATPEALEVCAACMRAGARPDELIDLLFHSPTPAQVRLQHLALGMLRFHDSGLVATIAVTREMFGAAGCGPEDTEGFADIPISVRGVMAAAFLKELPGCGYIKVSMRSRGNVDVCAVARAFGGGGHMHAAGCELAGTIEEVRQTIARHLGDQCQLTLRA